MSVCVLGSINLDMVVRVGDLPKPGETIAALSLDHHPGGKGANQAIAAARTGADTLLIGAVGRDDAGAAMRARLAEAGVDLSGMAEIEGQPTGRAFITVSRDGENTIAVVGGANLAVEPRHVRPEWLAGRRVFLAQLETPAPAIEAMFRAPVAQAGVRILNAAPAAPCGLALFALAELLVVNQTELAQYAGLAGVEGWSDETIAAARRLISRPGQHVVITLGGAGVGVVGGREAYVAPGRRMPVVDTTGAGDCFCGALAARLSEGVDLDEAVRFANAAAALSVGRLGAGSSTPTRTEVEALLAAGQGGAAVH